jgi:hypothetical protein
MASCINSTVIARAEEVIKKYVNEKYAWDESTYKICLYLVHPMDYIMQFMVYNQDDSQLKHFGGGGKSFVTIFDTIKMEVLEELIFQ